MTQKIAVIGSGFAGLFTALALKERVSGAEITVFQNEASDRTISFHSGGGIIRQPGFDFQALKQVTINWGNTNVGWLWSFFWRSLVFEGWQRDTQFALSDRTFALFKEFGIDTGDQVVCEESRWYDIGATMQSILKRLDEVDDKKNQKRVQFVDEAVAPGDERLNEYVKVFSCRGAADNAKFNGATEVVSGVSEDVARAPKEECFTFVDGHFESPVSDNATRLTYGMFIGDGQAPPDFTMATPEEQKKITERVVGSRLVSVDKVPFYLEDGNTIYVNGGSFVGMHTYAPVATWAVEDTMGTEKKSERLAGFNPGFNRVSDKKRTGLVSLLFFVVAMVYVWVQVLRYAFAYLGGGRRAAEHLRVAEIHRLRVDTANKEQRRMSNKYV